MNHNNIFTLFQPYGPDVSRSDVTRKRLDNDIPGPLYIHRWLKPAADHKHTKVSLKLYLFSKNNYGFSSIVIGDLAIISKSIQKYI